jgi:SAM-dependent methyltransferase
VTGIEHQPDEAYFDVMAEQARRHWWYEGRRALVTSLLEGTPPGIVVDVGCGTGDNLGVLDAIGGRPTVGFELSPHAVRRAPTSGGGRSRVGMALAEHLPVASGVAALVSSMDVIEHLDDDVAALREYHRVLRPGGRLLITVPAYPSLWSAHDDWAAHRRRYRTSTLVAAIEAAGFEVDRTTHFNSFLVPPAVLLRRTPLRRLVHSQQDEVGATSPTVARVMGGLSALERRWTRRHRMPAGLSILALAHRRR